ncbi:MAG: Ig-like domain-containing protein [Actinomycetia bacterium]|nr:Ig-like domain-containing protein [Actinomycetes bacterium]
MGHVYCDGGRDSRTATLGTVSIATGRGSIDYTPDTNVTGVDRFDYTITDANGATGVATVTIGAVSDRPVAVDDFASTNEATPVTIDMVATDTDEDGDALSVESVGDSSNGTAEIKTRPDGTTVVVYEPSAGFNGRDSFACTVSDGNDGRDDGTVEVTVVPPPSIAPAEGVEGWSVLVVRWAMPVIGAGGLAVEGFGLRYCVADAESGGGWLAHPVEGVATSTTISGLSADTRYEVQVRTVNAAGAGLWSRSGFGRTDPEESTDPEVAVDGGPVVVGQSVERAVLNGRVARVGVSAGELPGVSGLELVVREASWREGFGEERVVRSDLADGESVRLNGRSGRTYCFSGVAVFEGGDRSAAGGERCVVVPVDDRRLVRSEGWDRRKVQRAFLGDGEPVAV